MPPHDTTPPAHAVDASAPPSTLAVLHQRELAVLAELERRQARLAERIAQQQRRVRAAERLLTGEGQQ